MKAMGSTSTIHGIARAPCGENNAARHGRGLCKEWEKGEARRRSEEGGGSFEGGAFSADTCHSRRV